MSKLYENKQICFKTPKMPWLAPLIWYAVPFDRKIGIARNLYDAVLNLLPTHNTLTRISHFML